MKYLAMLAMLLASGCGSKSNGGGDDGGGDGGTGTIPTSIAIAPAVALVDLMPAGAGFSGTQAFTVTASFADGTTADITADVQLAGDTDSGVNFTGPTATATIAGHHPITGQYRGVTGTAELDAKLTGSVVGDGVTPAQQAGLDGATATTTAPAIAYPPAGALFPINVTPLEVHAHKGDASQTTAKVTFTSSDQLAFSYYEPCTASPAPGNAFPDACIVTIAGPFATQLAGVSEAADVAITIRLVDADGGHLGESQPVAAAWAKQPLSGGLYYWTTAGNDSGAATELARYDFDGDASAPTIYLADTDAPKDTNNNVQCIGCHAVSPNGTRIAFASGGSAPGWFSLFDVQTQAAFASEFQATPFANMATFNADGSRIITEGYGAMTLRAADVSLAAEGDPLFPEVTEQKTHAFWSPSGRAITFVSWTPSQTDADKGHITGDMVQGGQIWIAPSDGQGVTGAATSLVPRVDGATSYYPAISDDDAYVVFDRSSCSGPANSNPTTAWGAGACDGYNDISANLMVVPAGGGDAVALVNANGGASPLATNSWPRWSPDHGTFRGKRLYWVAFSSRRNYGLALEGSQSDTTKPQLWFAAIAIDPAGGALAGDPSFAAVWLPGQDPSLATPRGNHTPVWTSRAVLIN